jgi:hypothetical protein
MFNRFLGEWDRLVFSGYGRIDLAGNLAIAKMARATYPGIIQQLFIVAHFLMNSLKSIFTIWIKD